RCLFDLLAVGLPLRRVAKVDQKVEDLLGGPRNCHPEVVLNHCATSSTCRFPARETIWSAKCAASRATPTTSEELIEYRNGSPMKYRPGAEGETTPCCCGQRA